MLDDAYMRTLNVIYRIGSLEMRTFQDPWFPYVIYRIGSLEKLSIPCLHW